MQPTKGDFVQSVHFRGWGVSIGWYTDACAHLFDENLIQPWNIISEQTRAVHWGSVLLFILTLCTINHMVNKDKLIASSSKSKNIFSLNSILWRREIPSHSLEVFLGWSFPLRLMPGMGRENTAAQTQALNICHHLLSLCDKCEFVWKQSIRRPLTH